jgi:ABC-type Na+ efflux pump permease subunit
MKTVSLLTLIAIWSAVLGFWSIRRAKRLGADGLGQGLSGAVELLLAVVLLVVVALRVFAP